MTGIKEIPLEIYNKLISGVPKEELEETFISSLRDDFGLLELPGSATPTDFFAYLSEKMGCTWCYRDLYPIGTLQAITFKGLKKTMDGPRIILQLSIIEPEKTTMVVPLKDPFAEDEIKVKEYLDEILMDMKIGKLDVGFHDEDKLHNYTGFLPINSVYRDIENFCEWLHRNYDIKWENTRTPEGVKYTIDSDGHIFSQGILLKVVEENVAGWFPIYFSNIRPTVRSKLCKEEWKGDNSQYDLEVFSLLLDEFLGGTIEDTAHIYLGTGETNDKSAGTGLWPQA